MSIVQSLLTSLRTDLHGRDVSHHAWVATHVQSGSELKLERRQRRVTRQNAESRDAVSRCGRETVIRHIRRGVAWRGPPHRQYVDDASVHWPASL